MDKKLWEERLALYDKIINAVPTVERKGKTMPYTSANGHMFSQLNKAGEIGIRLPKETQDQLIKTYQATPFMSYGATMKDYVLIPDDMLKDIELAAAYLEQGLQYVNSLEPK